jgi:hypothetical protein
MPRKKHPASIWLLFQVLVVCLPATSLGGIVLPAQFDWRDRDGKNFTTPVKNKDSPQHCSCCWAFAVVGAMESMWKIQTQSPSLTPDLAEQQLLSCSKLGCKWAPLPTVLDFIQKNQGLGEEAAFPYQASADLSCSQVAQGWQQKAFQIESWIKVTPDTESIKKQLLSGPVVAGMNVYDDFMSYAGGVYEHSWGAKLGGHFVLLVGWNDADGAWISKNSWGDGWGEDSYGRTGQKGWARIKYQTAEIQQAEAFALKLDLPAQTPPSSSPSIPPTPQPQEPPAQTNSSPLPASNPPPSDVPPGSVNPSAGPTERSSMTPYVGGCSSACAPAGLPLMAVLLIWRLRLRRSARSQIRAG